MQYTYDTVTEEPNHTLLYNEIVGGVSGAVLIDHNYTFGDSTLICEFDITLDATNKTNLDSIVANHDREPLSMLKSRLVSQANAIYNARRDAGTTYNGSSFSGSINAIASASMGKHKKSGYTYPINAPTMNGTKYSIANEADYDALFDAVELSARTMLESLADANHNIVTAVDKATAQAAYDAYLGA